MFHARETSSHDFPNQRVVINAKDVQGAIPFELWHGTPTGSIIVLNTAGVILGRVFYGTYVHVKSGFVVL
jgi:hypothetical protein